MTLVSDTHGAHGAVYRDRGGRRVVDHYRKPERVGKAVRNVVGAIEMGYGVLAITGEDRVEFIDNAVSNRIPEADGQGVYALLLDPQGGIETDMYVYNADERLLVFLPPERTEAVAEDWASKVFIQDVTIDDISDELGVFGVHGPKSTEKVASVLGGPGAPEKPLSFVRGSMVDAGVTVIASDAPLGEEGYEVVCAAEDAEEVLDTLLNRGLNAAPFGYRTWDALSLEAGTPLFEYELEGTVPNVLGLRNALDFEKGCYVGQEVVSRVENQGRPSRRLIGLDLDGLADATADIDGDADPEGYDEILPSPGAAVFDGDEAVGEVTRAAVGPAAGDPIALAFARFDADLVDPTVRVDGEEVAATRSDLPFPSVDGSAQSARLPTYPSDE
ncbi:CAF17-like 4Fe-4S cluster assembly/insertion protein YgfZ [Halorubrum lacusprofundi]|jgi:aminomethyltransferase|uniref:Folate-binding protein YgfZ n=1 Tax=Halorubrum lacusprofundi (strain ATCC 49239 / DSM 5036 / JCM 8891 / ACAM 34) TaxID=416348 RepID=B9LS91_HALLT|nr:glycine cleavage T C-terminal barrel domain-containing protein [Halorubrum lacusprofundi]ACM55936.1 folate-binding protein YgfZ [Halorubrum lacusprofundi ATCC 49239]MCG1006804.1 aminomethyltransferase family protein [Halorubrum lacusprofundi]